jgi:hypothetical protein
MSSLALLRGSRRVLVATLLSSATAWAVTIALAGLLMAAAVDVVLPIPLALRRAVLPISVGAGVAALLVCLVRGRQVFSLERVALYLEERVPALEYALVTALGTSGPASPHLERAVERAAPERALRSPVVRAIGLPLAALGALLGLFALAPIEDRRVLAPRPGDLLVGSASASPLASRLAPIVVLIAPPSYVRQELRELADPSAVTGLIGSRLQIRGRGASRGGLDSLGARLGEAPASLVAVADTWSVSLSMPEKPVALRLLDRSHVRLLTLEPVADQPPVVSLTAPSRDTTYALPRGRLVLAGGARDDFGLDRAEFELLRTTGSGERFDIRGWTLGTVAPGGARAVSLQSTILLDTLKLSPGDVLHVRVTARDLNDVSGPGVGASDSRTIRIADPRVPDTAQVVSAAVAELDTTMLSQRMLIIRAETLQVRRRTITEQAYHDRSDLLGRQQDQLRERVEAIIEELTTATDAGFTGHTESSLILSEAVAAMKLARRELGAFRVGVALPHMYRALKALERVRSSNRLYLRGIFPKLVVDLDKVRLKGTDRPAVDARKPRPEMDDPRKLLQARLDGVMGLLSRGAGGALDSLVLIRVEALTLAADVALPLGRAIADLRAGREPLPQLRTARRLLLRATETVPGVHVWRGAP